MEQEEGVSGRGAAGARSLRPERPWPIWEARRGSVWLELGK